MSELTENELRARIADLEAQLNDARTAVDDEQHKADSMRDYCRELEAQQRAGVPDGWKLVPVEPTAHMLHAACDEEHRPLPMWSRMKVIYTAMLAAVEAAPAPKAQEQAPQPAEVGAGGLEELRQLLEIAKCPCCDGSGAYYDNMGDVIQCQWCYERTAALAASQPAKEQGR